MTNEFTSKPPSSATPPDPLDTTVPLTDKNENIPVSPPVPSVAETTGLPPVPSVAETTGLPPVPSVAETTGVPPVPQVANLPAFATERAATGPSWAGADPGPEVQKSGTGRVERAQAEAGAAGKQGMDSAREVASTAMEEAGHVAEEAKQQATDLFRELSSDLREQAAIQQEKIAHNLRSISDEFRSMAASAPDQGTAVSWVRQAGHQAGGMADWLGGRDPGSLLAEVKGFARQRPGTFLALAAGAGLLAGRLARGIAGAGADEAAQEAGPSRRSVDTTSDFATAGPHPGSLGQEFSGSGLAGNPALDSGSTGGTGRGTGYGAVNPPVSEKGYPAS